MSLEQRLVKIAFKMKNIILLDFSFPGNKFLEFKKIYDNRYISIPCRKDFAVNYASGLSTFGKNIVVYGLEPINVEKMIHNEDSTLNIKILREVPNGDWDDFEAEISAFGGKLLLIPIED